VEGDDSFLMLMCNFIRIHRVNNCILDVYLSGVFLINGANYNTDGMGNCAQ
jgi:hypothetical protein